MHRTATSIPLQITNGISLPLVMSWIVLSHVTLQNEVLGMPLSIFEATRKKGLLETTTQSNRQTLY